MSKMIPFDPALLSRPGWIFDCDGTIAHTMPLHWRAWNATTVRYGLDAKGAARCSSASRHLWARWWVPQ